MQYKERPLENKYRWSFFFKLARKLVFILSYLVKLGRNSTSPQLDVSLSKATIIIGLSGSLYGCFYHALNEHAVQISTLSPQLPRILTKSYPESSEVTRLVQIFMF